MADDLRERWRRRIKVDREVNAEPRWPRTNGAAKVPEPDRPSGKRDAFGSTKLAVRCPQCGHKFTELAAYLEASTQLTCPRCHVVIEVKGDELRDALELLREQVTNLLRKI